MRQVFTVYLCLILSFRMGQIFCQPSPQLSGPVYYTVLGSFAIQSNAKRFIKELDTQGVKSYFIFNQVTKIYNVYHQVYSDRSLAESAVVELRKNPKFFDAWIKRIPGEIGESEESQTQENFDFDDARPMQESAPAHVEPQANEEPGKVLLLSLVDSSKENVVNGNIKMVDPTTAKLIGIVEGNENIFLSKFSNPKKVLLICDVFGYRMIQQSLNIEDPQSDSAQNVEVLMNQVKVQFDLIRYQRGDIQPLFNVYFYNDASIMMQESTYQLQELLSLMKQNPKISIRLHGHSNGGHFGNMVVPTTSTNFFSLASESRQIPATAKVLSFKRAEMVRNYLIYHGVEGHRIKIKSWGGGRPIFDKHSPNAKKNLRVEVEITED